MRYAAPARSVGAPPPAPAARGMGVSPFRQPPRGVSGRVQKAGDEAMNVLLRERFPRRSSAYTQEQIERELRRERKGRWVTLADFATAAWVLPCHIDQRLRCRPDGPW